MSAQADFGWWRKAVETERERPRLIGCREGIFRVKTTHQQGERNCNRWRTHTHLGKARFVPSVGATQRTKRRLMSSATVVRLTTHPLRDQQPGESG